ncbi:winged helix-turn-helix transcriptional regulator [Sphingomonas sp. ac-8]|uniref:winged helix-turn-helix transcriptional regulator n=1 Tax=Sphingomonas sp. ac-8 TaxID=3242977 RepID=UPI003A80982B
MEKRWYDDACGAALGMEFVGERWALLIMRELLLGPRRFGELRAGLPGLSANILTQRLASLEASGIVRRYKLPSPANVQVYELTAWGRESEPVILALARWALRSPTHDPSLPFSAVSLLLSLRMLLVPGRVGAWRVAVGIRVGEETFVARLGDGELRVARGSVEGADTVLSGGASAFLPVVYGGMPLAAAEAAGMLRVEGNRAAAERFVTLFALPDKVAVE